MPDLDSRTDAELLKQFADGGSHAAFAALVKRHGPMVHAVSMRVMSNHHDAQDVTQAVFLVLARRAAELGRQPSAAGWLHTVARRLSLNARKSRESRQRREAAMHESTTLVPDSTLSAGFRRELDAALERLPDRYRQPLVLFHLEDVSLKEAARLLDLHPTTLRTRLSRGREMLRRILARRGVEIASSGVLVTLFTAEAKAASLTPALFSAVLDATTRGDTTASSSVLELTGKVVGYKSFPPSLSALTILMKAKATLISGVAIMIAAVGITVHQRDGSDETSSATTARHSHASRNQRDRDRTAAREATDPLSRISSRDEFNALVESVLLIEGDAGRLAAIRERLGLEISEDQYREALAAYGYQMEPMRLYAQLLGLWLRDDPQAAMLWTRRFSGEFGSEMQRRLLVGWLLAEESAAKAWVAGADLDPALVAAAGEDLEKLRQQRAGLPQLPEISEEASAMLRNLHDAIRAYQASGPEAAKERSQRMQQLGTLVEQFAKRDPKAAVEFAYSLHPSTRSVLGGTVDIHEFIRMWGHADPEAALEWAKGMEHPQERIETLAMILPSWQLKFPERAIDEAIDLDQIPDRQYPYLIGKLVGDWAVTDPLAAIAFAMELEDAENRVEMVLGVVESWARKDPHGAGRWAAAQPPGEIRDTGLSNVSERLSLTNYASARQLVREIEDRRTKDHAVHRMLTGGKAIRHHFEAALRLADEEMSELPYDFLQTWAHEVRPDDIPAFMSWLEDARDAGRIQFHPHHQSRAIDRDRGYQFILKGLRPRQE